jgi:hypothetical protein
VRTTSFIALVSVLSSTITGTSSRVSAGSGEIP